MLQLFFSVVTILHIHIPVQKLLNNYNFQRIETRENASKMIDNDNNNYNNDNNRIIIVIKYFR